MKRVLLCAVLAFGCSSAAQAGPVCEAGRCAVRATVRVARVPVRVARRAVAVPVRGVQRLFGR
jgi:opacity protein-like surface antigen